jgi:hypothetical protein
MKAQWLRVRTTGALALLSGWGLGCSGQGSSATGLPGDAGSGGALDGTVAPNHDAGVSTQGSADASSTDVGSTAVGSADANSTDGGSACPGVPILPDSTGDVPSGSNTVGIHGSWFVYSDCNDQGEPDGGPNCSAVTSPPKNSFPNVGGKMCTSGQTSTATGAWGAGIGLELNDGPPQEPYNTVMQGVTGFCFQLSGTVIPSTSIRVAFPTTEDNDNAPFESVTTPGQHTVLFTDTAQGSWVTTPTVFDPTMVTLLQFQIPSSTTEAVPWDFCIEGLTAITQ